jgi:hypothetical protein
MRMREIVAARLRSFWPTARIIHELPVRYSTNRLDMAAITETELIGVEIKSSRDVLGRLEAQIRAFMPVTHRLWVCLAPEHNAKLPDIVEERERSIHYRRQFTPAQEIIERVADRWVEVWTVDADAGESFGTRGGYLSQWDHRIPWGAAMLDMLWNSELAAMGGSNSRHDHQVRRLADAMTGCEIVRGVCAALRARDAFAAESDPPIRGDVFATAQGVCRLGTSPNTESIFENKTTSDPG